MDSKKRLQLRRSFKLFVDRVMALQGNAPLNKFSLRCKVGSFFEFDVNGLIDNVLDRGVVELDLYIDPTYGYMLPRKVLMSKNLVKLKLVGTYDFKINVGKVSLPKLKTLHIINLKFYDYDDDDDDDDDAKTLLDFPS